MFLLFQLSSLFPQDSPPKMFQCCLLTELYFPSGQQCLIHMAQKKNAWFSKVISKLFLLSYATSFVVFLKTFLQSSFRFTTKLKGRFRDFPFISDPHTCIATLPWSPSLTRMVPFLQHWYIIITQSLEQTLGFTLGEFWYTLRFWINVPIVMCCA